MFLNSSFYMKKVKKLQEQVAERKLEGFLMLDPLNVNYTTGFFYIPTE